MNNGQIGSLYNSTYTSLDTGKFMQNGQSGVTATETAKLNAPAANEAGTAVQTSDSLVSAQDLTAGQFISNALKEAGITSSDRTMQLVQSLLSNGQSVDKNTLMEFNRLIKMFPDVDVQTLVNMKLNNIPVNNEMIAQYEQYSNNAGYIMKDLAAIADGLGDVLKSLTAGSGKEAAVGQLESITTLVKDMTGNGTTADGLVQNLGGNVGDFSRGMMATDIGAESLAHMDINGATTEGIMLQSGEQQAQGIFENQSVMTAFGQEQFVSQISEQNVQGQTIVDISAQVQLQGENALESSGAGSVQDTSKNLSQELLKTLDNLEQEASGLSRGELKANGTFLEKLTQALKQMPSGSEGELFKLLDKDDFKKTIRQELENALLLEPKDAAELEKVQKYYKKLQGALDNYISMSGQQTEAASQGISKTFQNMSDNLNFMQYVNEMMPYIQLPLKLLDENAHGDFYVMRNKKNRFENPDEFTAFLRLNMETLGELDVFIKLKKSSADIAFKVEKQEICEFIEKNIGRLEDGLEKKGVSLVSHVSKKEEEFSFVKDIIEGEASGVIEKYSFDMRM